MKKGQVTIFIIVAVVIVVSILVLLLFKSSEKLEFLGGGAEANPDLFLKNCIEDDVRGVVETLSYQGGSINPDLFIKFKFGDEEYKNISYLCYNRDYYMPCISQQPVLMNHEKTEISNAIEDKVNECFNKLIKQLEKDYVVSYSYKGFEVEILPDYVNIKMGGDINYEKSGEKSVKNDFDIKITTKFYDLLSVAQEIASQEAKYCNFDRVGYMIYYPDYEINVFRLDDTRIYTIKHTKTEEIFRFATRSCAIPAGII